MSTSTLTKAASASAAFLLLLGAAGCSDDGGGDVQAYCDFSASLDDEAEPTQEQYDEIKSLAPSEISDEVDLVVNDIEEVGPDAEEIPDFSDEFFAALDDIEAFEAENCDDGGSTEDSVDDE